MTHRNNTKTGMGETFHFWERKKLNLVLLHFIQFIHYSILFRENGTLEERNNELLEDSAAFGIGCTVVGIVQFTIGVISIALLNYSAQKQVSSLISQIFYQ